VIFLRKINDFEESAILQSLRITSLFGSPIRLQTPFEMSSKSIYLEYQIKLCFEKAFKNALDTDFGSKMTSRTTPKSNPKQL